MKKWKRKRFYTAVIITKSVFLQKSKKKVSPLFYGKCQTPCRVRESANPSEPNGRVVLWVIKIASFLTFLGGTILSFSLPYTNTRSLSPHTHSVHPHNYRSIRAVPMASVKSLAVFNIETWSCCSVLQTTGKTNQRAPGCMLSERHRCPLRRGLEPCPRDDVFPEGLTTNARPVFFSLFFPSHLPLPVHHVFDALLERVLPSTTTPSHTQVYLLLIQTNRLSRWRAGVPHHSVRKKKAGLCGRGRTAGNRAVWK